MEKNTYTQQFLQKRKFLVALPLLVLPFITILFWAFGGGKDYNSEAKNQRQREGLNTELPDANLKDDKALDKLSYYEKAASDSVKLLEIMKNDPYYAKRPLDVNQLSSKHDSIKISLQEDKSYLNRMNDVHPSPNQISDYSDSNESKVYRKIDELNAVLNLASTQPEKTASNLDATGNNKASVSSTDIDRLEQMINMTRNNDGNEDPEMQQLNGMMDKILDMQHPERVKDKIKRTSEANKGQVFAISTNYSNEETSLLVDDQNRASHDTFKLKKSSHNGFFDLNEDRQNTIELPNAIEAVIQETQIVVDGAIVKLRLMSDVYINGTLIPKNSFVFGIASLNGERLHISVNSIRHNKSLFPVQLSVIDMDGIDGIYVPGTITRDVAKTSAQSAVQGLGVTSLDPSLGQQAANVGIEAAKTLLTRKAKLVRVTVKGGYQVLLRDEKQKLSF